jgi:hypothetical protein
VAPGIVGGVGARSADVTYRVFFTNRENSALVTACWSIQKPSTLTVCAGPSSG